MVLHVVCTHFRSVFLICKYKKQILVVFSMRIENAKASDVLERILSAYGFTMQKELAQRLEIAKSNVAGWLQREQIPGNVIVQCALDTGADVNWIVTGDLAKSSFERSLPPGQGKVLYEEVMSNGGRVVLRRILDAYGFTTQKQLCDLLNISSGTVSTWIRRNFFPGDVVVTCALDTGVAIEWLALGKGKPISSGNSLRQDLPPIERKKLIAGNLENVGFWYGKLDFLPSTLIQPIFLESSSSSWMIERAIDEVSNGRWLLGFGNKFDIYDLVVLPNESVSVTTKNITFTCKKNEFTTIGKVIFTISINE